MLPDRVAIVGAGGFIGSHLVERLLEEGVRVEAVDLGFRRLSHCANHPLLTMTKADYGRAGFGEALTRRHRVIIHLAALCNPSLYNTRDVQVIRENFFAPASLAECCARNESWMIFFSTSEVYGYGDVSASLNEDKSPMVLGPVSARRWSYATAKLLTERWLEALGHERGLRWTVVRPFNVLGPRMDYMPGVDGEGIPRVMAGFAGALLRGEPMPLVDGGRARRAFTWVGDLVDAVVRILERPERAMGECFHIGNPDNEIEICALAMRLAEIYGELRESKKGVLPPLARPPWTEVCAGDFYGAGYEDSLRRLPDIGKARDLLGWSPRVGLDETLRRSLEWYVTFYALSPEAARG